MQVILEVIKGEQAGQRFVFDRHQAFTVGRKKNERVQFRIPGDPYFSRYHLILEISPPRCFVRDLGSRNGTYVNGQKVREAELNDGDLLRGGHTEMRVRIERDNAAAVSPEPPNDQLGPGPAAAADWETRVFGGPGEPGMKGLRCALCGHVPDDPQLAELTETRLLAYVCLACRQKHHDPQHLVPNYEKLAVLGRGGLGPVFKARRISSDKTVVFKMLAPELAARPEAVKLFLRQMLLSARLVHANIVPVVELGQAGSDLWIASEFVDGMDARELARQQGGRLSPGDAVGIVCQVLSALDYAHGLNLVHRDVKPSNILVTCQSGAYTARLADFGLLRNMDEAGVSGITVKGEVRGTLPFMPPEQVLDSRFVKPAGDLYAAGATLYWLLTGEFVHDFEARDPRGERKDPYVIILEDPITPIRKHNPAVPESLARAIERSLQPEPEDRYETAAEMARELQRAIC